jgi:hypothetical protein
MTDGIVKTTLFHLTNLRSRMSRSPLSTKIQQWINRKGRCQESLSDPL